MRVGNLAALVLLCLPLRIPPAHAAGTASPNEYVGLELAPGWLNIAPSARIREGADSFRRYSPGIAGTLRVARMGWGRWYWTPLQLGAGVGEKSAVVGHISTEMGLRQSFGEDRFLEIGTAVGAGLVWVLFDTWCDGHCYEGGMPVVALPVVRLGLVGRRASAALFARAFLPLVPGDADAYGMAFLFGLDLGFLRPL